MFYLCLPVQDGPNFCDLTIAKMMPKMSKRDRCYFRQQACSPTAAARASQLSGIRVSRTGPRELRPFWGQFDHLGQRLAILY
jgi:hypothetical protein